MFKNDDDDENDSDKNDKVANSDGEFDELAPATRLVPVAGYDDDADPCSEPGYILCANVRDRARVRLLVPRDVALQLEEEQRFRVLRRIYCEREREHAQADQAPSPEPKQPLAKPKDGKTVVLPDATEWDDRPSPDEVCVWNNEHFRSVVADHNDGTRGCDRDVVPRDTVIFRKMADRGPWRRVIAADPAYVRQALDASCPHMPEANEAVVYALELAQSTGQCPRLPPLLLVGEPGVGKTHYAVELAKVLGVRLHTVEMTTAQTNGHLHGSDRHWGNTNQGLLFDAVVLGSEANPLVLIDEIDKARKGNQYDPVAPLHGALEPSTAARTTDRSLNITFDASWVSYIATANTLAGVPQSLLSRFTLILCKPPGVRESLVLTKSVLQGLVESDGGGLITGFAREVAQVLAELPARAILQRARPALGRALAAGRRTVEVSDLSRQESRAVH